jgi:hypothetical protein
MNHTKLSLALAATITLAGCSSSSNDTVAPVDCTDCAVISSAITGSGGSSGVDFIDTNAPFDSQLEYAEQDLSDIRVATHGEYFYRIGRYQQDNITKYAFSAPATPIWQFSMGSFANPYDMIFASDTKAYVLVWGQTNIWTVDPSVTSNLDEALFHPESSDIDLSAYIVDTENDTGSNAAAGVIVDDILYVVLESLDTGYAPETGYLIAIDTNTDLEIDLNGAADGKGFALSVLNAGDIDVQGTDIYITGKGRYESWDGSRPVELTGGIEKIDVSDLNAVSSTLLIDDDDAGVQLTTSAVVSASSGYTVAYNDYQDNDLLKFNPSTADSLGSSVTGYTGLDLAFVSVGPNGNLWVGIGDATNPRIDVLDPSDDSLLKSIALTRNPSAIKFANNL